MNDVFILGAGFSKAISHEMPTMENLTREVLAKLQDIDPTLLSKLRTLGDNIEHWISYLSQDQPWFTERDNHYNLSHARLICGIIEEVVLECTTCVVDREPPDWLRSLVRAWHREQATVITLNYDTLIERAARLLITDDDQHIVPHYIYPPFFAHIASRTGGAIWQDKAPETFSLLKLHGSMNWYYSGRRDFYGETIFYTDVTPFGDDISEDEQLCREYARGKEVLIVPPAAEKTHYFGNEAVRGLWRDANHALGNAKRIVVVGYSLPQEDLAMRLFLSAIQQNQNAKRYLVDTEPKVLNRYSDLLGIEFDDTYLGGDNPIECFVNSYTNPASTV